MMTNRKNILICPLNWGLGHATRIVPLVNEYIEKGYNPIIAASGNALSFLISEFPRIEFIEFKGVNITYAKKPFFMLSMLFQLPLLAFSIVYEQYMTQQLVKKFKPEIILSDNRYGVLHNAAKNILISHQLFIKLPKAIQLFEPFLHWVTRKLINRFDVCYVPDYAEERKSLSGALSHGNPLPDNIKYIGPLSRFQKIIEDQKTHSMLIPDILILISGPEPLRTKFEQEMKHRFIKTRKKILLVCGKPSENLKSSLNAYKELHEGFTVVNHLESENLCFLLRNVDKVIARAGYSTIMDLHLLSSKAELIPTPGQTEQEYLAAWLHKNNRLA